ncbi:hypothetical protein A2U01_0110874, partial [Trifolium medium]|nr:hypothetical protein [Trifolium medium]
QFASVRADPRGDCPVWRSENGDFFPVGTGMEAKTPPQALRDGDWGRSIRPNPSNT